MKYIHAVLLSLAGSLLIGLFAWARWRDRTRQALLVLEWLGPTSCAISLLAVLLFLIICRTDVARQVRELTPRHWRGLFVLLSIVTLIRLTLIPATERVYYDEHTYLQIARGIAAEGQARVAGYGIFQGNDYHCEIGSYPQWPAGWPTILAIALRLTHYARWTGFAVNLVCSLITILLVALIAVAVFPKTQAWLAATAIFACLPENQVWSRTSASEIFAAGTTTFAMLCAIGFSRNPTRRLGYLLAVAIALSVQVRNEMLALAPLYVLFILSIGGRAAFKKMQGPALILAILLIPQSLHLGAISLGYGQGPDGVVFGIRYVQSNLTSVGQYISKEPIILLGIFLALFGSVFAGMRKSMVPLWGWGGSVFLLPMFYFAGSYAYPGGERFALAWGPALAILAGVGAYRVHAISTRYAPRRVLIVLWGAIFCCALFWVRPYVVAEDRKTFVPRQDTEFLRTALRSVPETGIVVTTDPPVVIAEGRSAVFLPWVGSDLQRLRELAHHWTDGIYFFESPSLAPEQWPGGEECKERILSMFQATVVQQQTIPEGRQVLYQLFLRSSAR